MSEFVALPEIELQAMYGGLLDHNKAETDFKEQTQYLQSYDEKYKYCKDFQEIKDLFQKRKDFFLIENFDNEEMTDEKYKDYIKKLDKEQEYIDNCFFNYQTVRKTWFNLIDPIKRSFNKFKEKQPVKNDSVFFTITSVEEKCPTRKLEIIMSHYLKQIKCKDFLYCIEYGQNNDNPHIHGIVCANRKTYRTGGFGHSKGSKKGTPERSSCRYDIIKAINNTFGLYNFDIRCEYTNYDRCSKYILKQESKEKIVLYKNDPESKDLIKYENEEWLKYKENTKCHKLVKKEM